jgi:hypothetical protein
LKKKGNINFVLIGAKATGKTVYLASLYLNEKSITSQDGHTIEYLKPLADALLEGQYPQATAGTLHELMFNYKDDNFACEFQIDDVDGYFIETMHKDDKATQKQRDTLIKNIKNSEGIIFFFPYEEEFNEESIKNFNYEIDTVISKLTKMYDKYDTIPIPVVIAISKWDKSPFFKSDNEYNKALEYIESNKFLKIAKEKIEHHFPNFSIIPMSSIGKDINNMEPYNIKKPIQFFLKETFRLWEEKIERIKNDKPQLLKYLSKLYTDLKFWKNGKYNKLYDALEQSYADEIFNKLENINTYQEYKSIENEYKDVILYLKDNNREKILQKAEKLKAKETIKKTSYTTVAFVLIGILGAGAFIWYNQVKLKKEETKISRDIDIVYKNSNDKETIKKISEYENKFKDNPGIENKEKIERIKKDIQEKYKLKLQEILKNNSLITQYSRLKELSSEVDDLDNSIDIATTIKDKFKDISEIKNDYDEVKTFSLEDLNSLDNIVKKLKKLSDSDYSEIPKLNDDFKNTLKSIANTIISQDDIDNIDLVDSIINAFAVLGINENDLIAKLNDKKSSLLKEKKFNDLKNSLSNRNFSDAILKIETDWDDSFNEEDKTKIINILNKKFNDKVEDILKEMPKNITNIDDFNVMKNKLDKIKNLAKNNKIEKIDYFPKLNDDNNKKDQEMYELWKKYSDILENGVKPKTISFKADLEDNEPLGFKCGDEDEIELSINDDSFTYSYEDSSTECEGLKISWPANATFKPGKYNVIVKEKDMIKDDKYDKGSFRLTKNDIIKIYNHESVSKYIGSGYNIIFSGRE